MIAVSSIPADQRFSYRISPLPGRLMRLDNIGAQMRALARLLSASATDPHETHPMVTLITGCALEEDGSFRVDVAVVPLLPRSEMPTS